ncbi:Probable acyl-CoA thioesterase [Mycobacteroides abscessus]|nr:Probable acyl-CoA thioesterase [Mycobacteroides abscessus]
MFVGGHPTVNPPRTFGGQLMAQSLVASGRTVSEKLSLAAISTHFINGGDPELDIEFRVQRLRDERSFANRVSMRSRVICCCPRPWCPISRIHRAWSTP